jgi:DNA-binding NarL/FixJ family response regulator
MITMTSHDRVRVIVVEGAEFVRRGICGVLTQHGEPFELAAEISRAAALPQACELLEVRAPALAIVLLEHDGIDGVIEAVRAGANGVLLREASGGTLLAAIHDVMAGGAVLDPRLARGLFDRLATGGAAGEGMVEPGMDPAVAGALSQREREVLQALARGCRNKEISVQLGVSVGTVKTHLRHIFRKLHVADRTAAVLIALQGKLPKAA